MLLSPCLLYSGRGMTSTTAIALNVDLSADRSASLYIKHLSCHCNELELLESDDDEVL